MQEYELFIKQTCPYCHKVLRFMESAQITLPLRDIVNEPGAREELVNIGGKAQVPCLIKRGVALYESDDIIAYLKKQFM